MSRILLEGFDYFTVPDTPGIIEVYFPDYWYVGSSAFVAKSSYLDNIVTGVNSAAQYDLRRYFSSQIICLGFWYNFGTKYGSMSSTITDVIQIATSSHSNDLELTISTVLTDDDADSATIGLRLEDSSGYFNGGASKFVSQGGTNIQIYAEATGEGTRLFQVKINGTLVLNCSPYSVHNTGTTFSGFRMYRTNMNWNLMVDDIIVDDSEWTGASKVRTLYPGSIGTHTQWMPSAPGVDNYWLASGVIHPLPSEDGNYFVTTATALNKDSYGIISLPEGYTVVDIRALQLHLQAITLPGQFEYIQFLIRTGGTDYYSSSIPINWGWELYSELWQLNPVTGLAWTSSEIEDLEIGFRLVSS